MTEFDIAALEKALAPKGGQLGQDLPISPTLSKEALLAEAVKLEEESTRFRRGSLRTRFKDVSYLIRYGALLVGHQRQDDLTSVPRQVFERLVANGRHKLKDYHEMINRMVQLNPELALEANLEGKSGTEVLRFIYYKRREQVRTLVASHVSSPEVKLALRFPVQVQFPSGLPFKVIVAVSPGGYPNFEGIDLDAKKSREVVKAVHFFTYFEQVESEINRQLDTIVIKKGVTK